MGIYTSTGNKLIKASIEASRVVKADDYIALNQRYHIEPFLLLYYFRHYYFFQVNRCEKLLIEMTDQLSSLKEEVLEIILNLTSTF